MLILDTITNLLSLTRSLGSDEALSFFISSLGVNELVAGSLSLGQSPVYYLLLLIWSTLLGNSEIILRCFSLLWAGIAIVYIHHIIIDVFKVGLKNSYRDLLFFALNPVFLILTLRVGPQIMYLSLSIISFYYLLMRKPRIYLVVSVLLSLVNWSYIVVLALQGAYFVVNKHKSIKEFVAKSLPAIVISLITFGFLMVQDIAIAFSNLATSAGILFATFILSLLAFYIFNYASKFTRAVASLSILILSIAFFLFISQIDGVNMRAVIMDINAVNSKGDAVYVKDPQLYYLAKYYYQEPVFVYADQKKVRSRNCVAIKKTSFTKKLPTYPKKAFVIDSSGKYEAMALY